LGFISAMTTKAVIAAIGTKLFLAKIIIAYAVTYSVTYIATGSAKAGKSRVNLIKNQHQNYRPFCLARYRLLIHERLRFS
jgi:hypothetical protein